MTAITKTSWRRGSHFHFKSDGSSAHEYGGGDHKRHGGGAVLTNIVAEITNVIGEALTFEIR